MANSNRHFLTTTFMPQLRYVQFFEKKKRILKNNIITIEKIRISPLFHSEKKLKKDMKK